MLDAHLSRWYEKMTGRTPGQATFFYCHKTVLVSTAVLVCLFAFLVVNYAQTVPDIGLRSAFNTEIIRKFDSHFRPVDAPHPQVGDTIVQFRGRPITIWPRLLREISNLPEPSSEDGPVEVSSLPPETSGLHHVLLNGEELVQVQYEDRITGHRPLIWCVVDRAHVDSLLPSVLWFLLKGGLFLVALLVYWSRPQDRPVAQFFWLSVITVGAFMGGYHWWRIITQPGLILVFMVCAILVAPVSLHFYVLFPRPKQWLQQHPIWTLLAIYLVPLIFLAGIVCNYVHIRGLVQSEPLTEEGIRGSLDHLLTWILIYLGISGVWYLASVICLVHSYMTAADVTERNQVKCILFGSVVALAPIGYSLYLAFWDQQDFGGGAATWPMFAASACITLAFTVSITRYRLMQLDQILSSSMMYFLISFLAGLLYYAVVFVGILLIGRRFGEPSLGQALLVSTVALVLTLVLDLARSRLKKVLDRRFHRDKSHLDRTLRQMGQALEQLVDPPTLARKLLQASSDLVGVSRGAIYLREGHPPLYRLADALGTPPALNELASGCPLIDALQSTPSLQARSRFPADPAQVQLRFLGGEVAQTLMHEGQLLALLILGPKEPGYTTEDLNTLAALAHMTALALENAERHRTIDGLNRDLQDKVEKISEQQRRIMALQSQLLKGESRPPANGTADPKTAPAAPPSSEEAIVGSSPAIRDLLTLVKKVAQSSSAVLLRGESGTGKELLARALHEHSARASKPFVKVHCAALSSGLLESELFGHVKGAFTGAHRDKVGRFELANGGTLFLDEIGDINLETQTKLLRVLQEMIFERVGSSEPIQVDVRVVAATHQDLERLIKEGRFREDLYYRLNVISVHVPALRERREDIAELAHHFLRFYATRSGKPVAQLDDDAMVALKSYHWPGNIRQLENVIERAVVVAEDGTVTLEELPPEVHGVHDTDGLENGARGPYRARHTPLAIGRGKHEEREQRERERLVRALALAKGNKAEAARALGLARSTMLSRLKKYGLG